MKEEWRDIKGYEGAYQISRLGAVRGLDRTASDGRKIKGQRLRARDNGRGYPIVRLCAAGQYKACSVHRLVAVAFIPNPLGKPDVNHLNGNTFDPAADNLEWVTRSENCLHAFAVLGRKPNVPRKGRTRPRPIIAIGDGGKRRRFESAYAAQRDGYDQTSICRCLSGKRLTHGGYVWRYAEEVG